MRSNSAPADFHSGTSLYRQLERTDIHHHGRQVKALARHMILNTSPDQLASMARLAGFNFCGGHPDGADYALVQRLRRDGLHGVTAKGDSHPTGGLALGVIARSHIDAQQGGGRKDMARFFQRFPNGSLQGRFTGLKVAGGGIQAQAVSGMFFHEQVISITLYHCRNSDTGLPSCVHGGDYPAGARK